MKVSTGSNCRTGTEEQSIQVHGRSSADTIAGNSNERATVDFDREWCDAMFPDKTLFEGIGRAESSKSATLLSPRPNKVDNPNTNVGDSGIG